MLDLLETIDVCLTDKSDSHTIALGTRRTSDTVYIVLCIVGYVVVDDCQDIVDVNASGHDIGSHEHISLSGLESVHHLVALLLGEVAVHLVTVDMHGLQTARNLLDAFLLA